MKTRLSEKQEKKLLADICYVIKNYCVDGVLICNEGQGHLVVHNDAVPGLAQQILVTTVGQLED